MESSASVPGSWPPSSTPPSATGPSRPHPAPSTSAARRTRCARKFFDEVVAAGTRPESVADLVHDAVCNDRFWIFTDLDMVTVLADKDDSIMQNRHPAPPMLF